MFWKLDSKMFDSIKKPNIKLLPVILINVLVNKALQCQIFYVLYNLKINLFCQKKYPRSSFLALFFFSCIKTFTIKPLHNHRLVFKHFQPPSNEIDLFIISRGFQSSHCNLCTFCICIFPSNLFKARKNFPECIKFI